MGIQGFTKFINDRAQKYFDNYELRDCTLIIDGHSISCQLYNWKHWQFDARSNNCYGGDYDKYAYIVENFFQMLKEVKVKPIVVFDGGFEQRKLPTILTRMKDKLNIASELDPIAEAKQPYKVVFPLFLREAFKDVLRKLDVQMLMCEYEGDTEIASIAKQLDCPVLTFDSDYFLFGVQYIPFKTLNSKVTAVENWRTGTYKSISCKVYRIEKFLGSFPGLHLNTLHLLPVLLGNDYIDCNLFRQFLVSKKIDATNNQEKINLVLEWLRTVSPKVAIKMFLKYFNNYKERVFVLNKIEKIVSSYYLVEGKIIKYIDIKKTINNTDKTSIKIDFCTLREEIKNFEDNKNALLLPSNQSEQCLVPNNIEVQNDSESASKKQVLYSTSDNINKSTEVKNDTSKGNDLESHIGQNFSIEKEDPKIKNYTEQPEMKSEEGQIEISNKQTIQENREIEKSEIIADSETTQSVANENVQVTNTRANTILSFEETHLEKENTSENPVSNLFMKNFIKAEYPSSFMDILTQNRYYCIPQVENYCEDNSHHISFDILCAIHKILTNSNGTNFTIVGRSEGTKVEWLQQKIFSTSVPSLEEIEQLSLQGRREVLFEILNIDNKFSSSLDQFPTEWHTLLISLKYATSKISFERSLIYSIIIVFMILNYIDQKIGYYRSPQRFKMKFNSFMQNLPPVKDVIPFRVDRNCFYYFPSKDCIVFMQKIIPLFTVNPESSLQFDRKLIHQMAKIQSVLLHIKYLNSLLKYPYPNLIIHQILDCTFVHNLTKYFNEKSPNLDSSYLNVFFKDTPTILASFKYVLSILSNEAIL